MIKLVAKIMSFTPKSLLSNSAKERFIENAKELPVFMYESHKPTIKASVLVPLCVIDEEVHILYTLRSTQLKRHSGQVCFPGGKMDGDETDVETALRETEEEIGLPRRDLDIWCQMSPFQGRDKNMLITPVVAVVKDFEMSKLLPNVYEVDEIFTVPISALCDATNHGYLVFKPPMPLFTYEKFKIWGITGLITHLFLQSFLSPKVYQPDFMRKKYTYEDLMPSKL